MLDNIYQYFIFLFLMLTNEGSGGKGECGKVKIYFSKPRLGKILCHYNYIKI